MKNMYRFFCVQEQKNHQTGSATAQWLICRIAFLINNYIISGILNNNQYKLLVA